MIQKNKLLQVSSIIMIIGGVIGVVAGTMAVMGVGLLALTLGSEAKMGLLFGGSVLSLVSSLVSMVAGIIGVINADRPKKAKICIFFGVLAIGSAILASTLSMMGGNNFKITSLLVGLVLPTLYLIRAFQNKELAQTMSIENIKI